AREGKKVGLNISFDAAFWGVKAFGGQLFDQEGRVTLDRGGFANWLTWLKNAQSESNIILDSDETTLLALFQEEEVAYIAGRLDMLPQLQQSLGEDAIGVVPLPGGPNNASGPFLRTQALMLNRYAADAQEKLALQLAQFLTNAEQQTHLLRRTGRVPANTRVRVDPIVFPLAAGFSAQTKTAVPVVNLPQMEAVFSDGNEAFLQTLTGVVEPNEAARQFTDRINSQFGFEPIEVDLVDNCRISGTLQVWHRWTTEPESSALSELASRFERRCPNTTIELTTYETADLFETYTTVGGQAEGPDLIIGPSDWIVPWADQGLINSLDGLLEVDELQQYISTAQVALQVNERVYGLPLALNLLALYYKANLVTDPPRVLDDLVTGATIDRPVVIPIDFYYGSWGALAFGSITYDEGNQPDLNPDGFTAWLQWLQQAQTNPGIILSPDPAEVEPLFSDGPAAYYVGEAAHLTQLQQAVGRANLRVVPLPAGPADEARPPLTAEGVMINPAALMVQDQAALALEFARYVTNLESQTYLMERANRIPSHVNVEAIAYPAISGFLEQTKTASVWPNTPELNRWQLLIDDLYNQVIFGEADAVEAVETLVSQLENETE
ncbi:MAG TPA: extracellular solute-binding protein, partial [Anaerolineae bacterium]|nr:extracellular solute-binding protein [Anaerolineae bacterium]